ncbi:MAG: fused MFS/spermidine synthase, partial [Actinomyces sp.]|nr:fused MFS/spermidine synthase [Actinomyces sp.]
MSSRDAHEFAISTGSARVTWDGSHATVFVNGAESSSVDVDHPEVLEFEYMQHMDAALEALAPSPEPVRALHIGGAGCALAWAWSIKRPQSRHCVVEIDENLAHTVRDLFDLPRSPQLKIRVGEGRQVLDSTRPERWDVIVRDAFSDQSVPRQLMTLQAARSAWD